MLYVGRRLPALVAVAAVCSAGTSCSVAFNNPANKAMSITSVTPFAGPPGGGNPVTIAGVGFQDGATVTFDQSPCNNVTVDNTNQLRCTPYAHPAGKVTVYVTNPDNHVALLADGFTYQDAPAVVGLFPTGGPASGGQRITVLGIGFLPGAIVTLGGNSCIQVEVLSSTQLRCTTVSHVVETVDIQVTNIDGQFGYLSDAYTYQPGPTVTAITPTAGPLAGGTPVTITGSNFVAGALVFLDTSFCNSVVVQSPTEIRCTTTQHLAGAVSVSVVNTDTQSGTLPNGYTYQPAPAPTAVQLSAGALAGGTLVTIVGTGFVAGAKAYFGTVTATDECTPLQVVNGTTITCTTPGPRSAGAVNVIINNNDGQSGQLSNGYTYQPAPTVTSVVAPAAGALAGGTVITINGTNFLEGATATVGGVACGTLSLLSSTQVQCTTGAHAPGVVSVTVTNADTQFGTAVGAYTYKEAPVPTAISLNYGPAAGSQIVTITGTFFENGATITIGGTTCASPQFISATELRCTTPAKAVGSYNVVVRNPDNQTGTITNGFTYQDPPAVASIGLNYGPLAGSQLITVTGTGFRAGITATIAGSACTSVNISGPYPATSFTCQTPLSGTTGFKDVVVQNQDGQSSTATNAFRYQNAPTISSVGLNYGPLAGTQMITVTGTDFQPGIGLTIGGSACTAVNVAAGPYPVTSFTCVTPSGTAGLKNLVVANADGQSSTLNNGFRYQASPAVASLDLAYGPLAGGQTVTVTGTDFQPGVSVKIDGNACGSVSLLGSPTSPNPHTQLTCVTPSGTAGLRNVQVQNADGQSSTLNSGFRYQAAPTVSSIGLNYGPLGGGQTITVIGTDFQAGVLLTIDGNPCGSLSISGPYPATTFTCVTPAGTAGAKNVVVLNQDGQSSTLTGGFRYQAPPAVTAMNLNYGPLAGGRAITVTGTGFQPGITLSIGGSACTGITLPAGPYPVTSLTCVTPSGTAGLKNVVVTNLDTQTSTFTDGYRYQGAPSVLAVALDYGPLAGGQTITITGADIQPSVGLTIDGNPCTSVTLVGSPTTPNPYTQFTCVTPAGTAGLKNLIVTNADGQNSTFTSGYRYQVAPTVAAVALDYGPLAGGQTITLTGTGFQAGVTLTIDGNPCTGVSVSGPYPTTTFSCTTPAGTAGAKNLVVQNQDLQSSTLNNGFRYQTSPTVTSLNLAYGPLAGGRTITVSGTNFQPGIGVTIGGAACTSVVVPAGPYPVTSLTCVTPSGTAGNKNVVVTNQDGQSSTAANAFRYTDPPAVTAVALDYGPLAGGQTITITGTEIQPGVSLTIGGNPCGSVSLIGSPATPNPYTQFTCVTPAGTTGLKNIVITNADTQTSTATNAFRYQGAPTVSSVALNYGPLAGGQTITVTGADFQAGITATIGGGNCGSVSISGPYPATSFTCVTPSGLAGNRNVVVTNQDAQTSTLTGGYRYTAGPTVSSIGLNYGRLAGGQTVTISGGEFQPGLTATIDGASCGSVSLIGSPTTPSPYTSFTCVTPSGSAGKKNVVVTNADTQSGTLSQGFRYQAAPVIAAVALDYGPLAGGQTITLTGTDFQPGVTLTIDGNACTGVSLFGSPTSPDPYTQFTCVTPANVTPGQKNLVVTNLDTQTSTATNAFRYQGAPTISSLNLFYGRLSGSQTITVTGTNFQPGVTVTIGGASCTSVTLPGGPYPVTSLTCSTPSGSAGNRDVTVTNQDAQTSTATGAFRFQGQPGITSISPDFGPTAGGITVTFTGTDFQATPTVTIDGNACTSVTMLGSPTAPNPYTQFTCVTPANGVLGLKNATVTNQDTQSTTSTNIYRYQGPPTFTAVNLHYGKVAGGDTVTITGTNFQPGMTVSIGGSACTGVTLPAGPYPVGSLTCTTPAGSAGNRDIVLTNVDGQSVTASAKFRYQPAPLVTSTNLHYGPIAGARTITINGSDFQPGMTVAIGGNSCTSVTLLGSPTLPDPHTQLTCVTPDGGTAGNRDIVLTNADTQSSTNALTLRYRYQGAPTISSISPDFGPTGGGVTITVTGADIQPSVSLTIGGASCTSVALVGSATLPDGYTQFTCVTPTGTLGQRDVVIANQDSQSTTYTNLYRYQGAPTFTAVNRSYGRTTGGETITITGSNFQPGMTVTVGGASCTSVTLAAGPYPVGSLTCATPTGTAGQKVNIVLTNVDAQSVTASSVFRYQNPPAATAVARHFGPLAGGGTITVTGTDFQPGITATVGGSGCGSLALVGSPTAPDPYTQFTCAVPAGGAGNADIVVTNSNSQTSTATGLYRYQVAPTVTSITPDFGPTTGGTTVTVVGTDFQPGVTLTIGGASCGTVTLSGSPTSPNPYTQFTCVTPSGSSGLQNVVVANADGQSTTHNSFFRYQGAPTFTAINRFYGSTAGGETVTITGTNFQAGITVKIGGSSCGGLSVPGPYPASSLTCTAPAGAAGKKNVVLTNLDGQSVTAALVYRHQAAPSITSIAKNFGAVAGGQTITVTGTDFQSGVTFSIGGVSCGSVSMIGSPTAPDPYTQFTCVTGAGSFGTHSATVTNANGQTSTLNSAYRYQGVPAFVSVTPAFGPTTGGTTITIVGDTFQPGILVTVGGATCSSVTMVGSVTSPDPYGTLTCVTPAGTLGTKNIVLDNQDGNFAISAPNVFEYVDPPNISSISLNYGPNAAARSITITGTGFRTGATVTVGGQTCTSPVLTGTTQVVCTTPNSFSNTTENVVVTNIDGQSGSSNGPYPGGYTYEAAPSITNVQPASGPNTGGTLITLTGTRFHSSASITLTGGCTGVVVTGTTQATCTTVGAAAGTYDVTLTNQDGQSGTRTSAYTFTSPADIAFVKGAASPNPPDPDNFGTTNVNVTHTYTVRNNGGSASETLTVSIFETNDPQMFFKSSDACTGNTLSANQTCTFNVTFFATQAGAAQGTFDGEIRVSTPGEPYTGDTGQQNDVQGTTAYSWTASTVYETSATYDVTSAPSGACTQQNLNQLHRVEDTSGYATPGTQVKLTYLADGNSLCTNSPYNYYYALFGNIRPCHSGASSYAAGYASTTTGNNVCRSASTPTNLYSNYHTGDGRTDGSCDTSRVYIVRRYTCQ